MGTCERDASLLGNKFHDLKQYDQASPYLHMALEADKKIQRREH